MKIQELFEGYDPTKGRVLASATDKDGYRIEIHSHVEEPLPDHFKGYNELGYAVDRFGTKYIFAPDGRWVQGGYWMNWPEPEWKIGVGTWLKTPLRKRAQLEADWQTHAYDPLKVQFKKRIRERK